jgi:SAM-dependent methyltransferase
MSEVATRRNREMWQLGDWDRVADAMAVAGPRLLDRIGDVGAGVRLLDIGTGSGGSVAIPAALRGAAVVGSDVTDVGFEAARHRAADAGVEVEWAVGDAADLPFEDDTFDVVTSTFGHMFAPDQQAAARELVRVCRPGGTIGLACWTPQGKFARFIATVVMLTPPPPPGFVPPALWGSEPHVTELLEPLGVVLDMRRTTLTMEYESPEAQVAHWESVFPPVVAAKARLGADGWPAGRAKLVELFEAINEREDGTMAAEYEYLEIVGRA